MSELFRLERLTFNNFKLFGDEYTINFNGNELVVFDGPNGHGKTTIYDAIELSLTGDIRRFSSTENQQNPIDVVVAHKNNKNCFVRLELKNNQKSIVIERRLKSKILNSDKKISNFKNLWDLYLIVNDEKTVLSQFDLNKLIGNPNISRDFTLFHYVEQEDTAHFLKYKKEKERAEALSVLFGDTVEMQNKVSKVEMIEKRIDQLIKDNTREKVTLEQRGNLEVALESQESKIAYKPLFEWFNPNLEWDKEEIKGISSEKKDNYLLDLHNIEQLVLHRNYYLLRRKHLLVTDQDDILKSFLSYSKYISKLDVLKDEFRKVSLVKQISPLLHADNFDKLLENPYLKDFFSIVKYEKSESFLDTLNIIVKGMKTNKDSSSFLLELLNYRSYLAEHLKNNQNEKECFLCGTDFENNSTTTLAKSIELKEIALKSILSDDSQRLEKIQSDFIKNVIPELSLKIEQYISSSKAPSKEILADLERASSSLEKLGKLEEWLGSEQINFKDLLLDYQSNGHSSNNIEQSVSEFKNRILDKVKQSPEGYDDLNDAINFENIFKIYFKEKPSYLRKLSQNDLISKVGYINQLYIDSISNDIKSYQDIKIKISELSDKKNSISEMRKSLKSAISRYQKLLIKDIEVPFYIYSGKILQAHQSGIGNGIFIKDKTGGEELKNIRFVSNWNSDHDVINTMSSGQIAAVVITLYLALNKVYAKGFAPLLIDDPVQTMDEINMISLVELLRNEFNDRQIILSTHEDHVSRYFIYKFLKYQKNVRQVKLLDRKEYQLSNKH